MADWQRNPKVIAALAALALVLVTILAIWLVAPAIQSDLSARATAALEAANIQGVDVTVDGRSVTLTGTVADEAQRAAAVAAVAALPGVASVSDHLATGATQAAVAQYRFEAKWDGRTITLTGFMPSRDAREGLVTHSRDTLQGAPVTDNLQIAPNAPDPNWPRIAEAGIAAMKSMRTAMLTMTGTDVLFQGDAEAESNREAALAILERLPAPYVATVDISVGMPAQPTASSGYRFGAAYDGISIGLSGTVPSTQVRDAIRTALKAALPDAKIDDRSTVEPGAPDGAWVDAALVVLTQFAQTQSATLTMDGRLIDFSAQATSGEARDGIVAAMGNLPVAYLTSIDLTVEGAGDATQQTFGGGGSPAFACQTGYDDILASSPIAFASGKSVIPDEAGATIERMVDLAATCPEARLEIAGHTDASGSASGNQKLSAARAEALEAALIVGGVDEKRLNAKGYGSSRPVAGNETDDDKARNRRIEVIVRP